MKTCHVITSILPSVRITSQKQDAVTAESAIFDRLRRSKSPSKSKRGVAQKGSVALRKEYIQVCCVSQDSQPRQSILRKAGKLGSKDAVKFSKGTWHQKKKLGKQGSIQRCHSEA